MIASPGFWPVAGWGTQSKTSASPETSARAAILLGFDSHELHGPPQRFHQIDHGGVGVLGQEDAAGAQNDARAAGLSQGVLSFGPRIGAGAILERRPLIEPALNRARHQSFALRQRRPGATIVPVPDVRG